MKTKPYPYKNSSYNKSCLVCGKPFRSINMHITMQTYNERGLKHWREKHKMTVRPEEIKHLEVLTQPNNLKT